MFFSSSHKHTMNKNYYFFLSLENCSLLGTTALWDKWEENPYAMIMKIPHLYEAKLNFIVWRRKKKQTVLCFFFSCCCRKTYCGISFIWNFFCLDEKLMNVFQSIHHSHKTTDHKTLSLNGLWEGSSSRIRQFHP